MLPTAPPIEFVSAVKTTGLALRIDQQGWYVRTNIAPAFRGQTPVPMAGQHVWRPMSRETSVPACTGTTVNPDRVCLSVFVVNPLQPILCSIPGCTDPPSYAGFGLDGVSLTLTTRNSTGTYTQTLSTAPGGAGNLSGGIRKNSTVDFVISHVPTGYVVPKLLQWKAVPVTDRDVWMLIELTK